MRKYISKTFDELVKEDIDYIASEYARGVPARKIAVHFSVTTNTLYSWMDKLGIKRRRKAVTDHVAKCLPELYLLYEAGIPKKEIAQRLDVSETTVERYVLQKYKTRANKSTLSKQHSGYFRLNPHKPTPLTRFLVTHYYEQDRSRGMTIEQSIRDIQVTLGRSREYIIEVLGLEDKNAV